MQNYTEIFNIQKTTLPLSKKQLDNLLSKKVFSGFVQCSYNELVQTLKAICSADSYTCTINPETLYNNGTNPFHQAECVISIEGTRYYEEFINKIISNEDNKEWTDFTTYSETFKDELKNKKSAIIRKYIWNSMNLNNWFNDKSVRLLQSDKDSLITDFEKFKSRVLMTSDLYSFIDSCNEGDLKKATEALSSIIETMMEKYKHELMKHITNNTKREELITVKHPIIKRIFIVSSFAKQCEKEWPKIKFTSLDKRSFETISLWNE